MRKLHIDLETYSPESIAKTGLYKYAQHPDAEILLLGYAFDDEPAQVLDLASGDAIPADLSEALLEPTVTKYAYNAAFEWFWLSRRFRFNADRAVKWLSQWRDVMLQAQYYGFPASLEAAGNALGLGEDKRKLATGKALIRYFCVPCKPTRTNGERTRNLPIHDPDKWELFKAYNMQDVESERAISELLPPVPEEVEHQWRLDQTINLRGVAVDMDLVDGALSIGADERMRLTEEAVKLTGLSNPNSVAQLTEWLTEEVDDAPDNLRKTTVADLLGDDTTSPKAKRVLEIRQALGKTSTKKFDAIRACAGPDHRVRGLMQFYGANRTGREAGRLVQIQNLPHDRLPAEAEARELVRHGDGAGFSAVYGSPQHALSMLIRTAFVPAPGKKFVDADFSAIEARVIAWLAGEDWVLDVFRTHGKIYEATASQMFGIEMDRIKKGLPEYAYRAKGKVATLALGYMGGPNALIAMGALRSGLTEEELPDIVNRWRASNPAIVQFWRDIERAAIAAVTAGQFTKVGKVFIGPRHFSGRDSFFITLPSGRDLFYIDPHLTPNRFGKSSLAYMGLSQETKKWKAIETYGGKLVENITQAVARDCLFYAMAQLEANGFPIVFDIHDEVVIEVDADRASLDDVVRIMSQPPPWAPDLPLNADGWAGDYFHKD